MFRRTRPEDGDLVAAAQRRLAALAQHHQTPVASAMPRRADAAGAGSDAHDVTAEGASPPTSAGARAPTAPRHLRRLTSHSGLWGVTTQHLTIAALAVVALVAAVAWWSLRSVPQAESVELSSSRSAPSSAPPTVLTPAPGATASQATQTSTAQTSRLVVDVAGKVRRPGIVELPAGSRVVDAIAAAGGANPGVSLTSLNLARLLLDGEQIVVGIDIPFAGMPPPAAGAPGGTTPIVAPVNLNTATAEQLDTLPGVGPVTAQAILAFRTDNGLFRSVDELLEVSGIGDATLADLRPYVFV